MTVSSFLREAADRLKELAEKAGGGPWVVREDPFEPERLAVEVAEPGFRPLLMTLGHDGCCEDANNDGSVLLCCDERPYAELAATFGNPQVARAVADWLRQTAADHEWAATDAFGVTTCVGCRYETTNPDGDVCPKQRPALAVAAVVLGRPAPEGGE